MKKDTEEERIETSEGEPFDISIENIDDYYDSLIEGQNNDKIKQKLKSIKEQPLDVKTKWLAEDDVEEIEPKGIGAVFTCVYFVTIIVVVTYYVITTKMHYPPPPKKPYETKEKEKRTREEKRKKKVEVEANEDGTCDSEDC